MLRANPILVTGAAGRVGGRSAEESDVSATCVIAELGSSGHLQRLWLKLVPFDRHTAFCDSPHLNGCHPRPANAHPPHIDQGR